MNRSIWKLPKLVNLLRATDTHYKASRKSIERIYARATTIGPHNIGNVYFVHNGLKFLPVQITENFVGYKFGQFAKTKKRVFHKKKKPKKS